MEYNNERKKYLHENESEQARDRERANTQKRIVQKLTYRSTWYIRYIGVRGWPREWCTEKGKGDTKLLLLLFCLGGQGVFDILWSWSAASAVGIGYVVSLSSSGQNGHICSYRYHWRSALKPRGGITSGISSLGDQHTELNFSSVQALLDDNWEDDILKWWIFFIPGSFLGCGTKKLVQSNVGTIVVLSLRETNWANLHSAYLLPPSSCQMKYMMNSLQVPQIKFYYMNKLIKPTRFGLLKDKPKVAKWPRFVTVYGKPGIWDFL